jgi:two-component sensor histidine kinase
MPHLRPGNFGLEVDATSEGDFAESDIAFLQGAANILGMAIERERRERSLKAALERQQVLLREIHHRVKNSLQLVSSMLNLQAGNDTDPTLQRQLREASSRVLAIARAHERLYKNGDVATLDLGGYLRDVCEDLSVSISGGTVELATAEGIRVATDRAVPLGLVTIELITNAAKHAYPGRRKGSIDVALSKQDEKHLILTVSDEGVGLPPEFDMRKAKGLGMRIVRSPSSSARNSRSEPELLVVSSSWSPRLSAALRTVMYHPKFGSWIGSSAHVGMDIQL